MIGDLMDKDLFERELRKEIADKVSSKMDYLRTCPNERDMILGIISPKDYPYHKGIHCNTDCWNKYCDSYRHDLTKQRYKKTEIVTALQFNGHNYQQVYEFTSGRFLVTSHTNNGEDTGWAICRDIGLDIPVNIGDYVICNNDEFDVIPEDVFLLLYKLC